MFQFLAFWSLHIVRTNKQVCFPVLTQPHVPNGGPSSKNLLLSFSISRRRPFFRWFPNSPPSSFPPAQLLSHPGASETPILPNLPRMSLTLFSFIFVVLSSPPFSLPYLGCLKWGFRLPPFSSFSPTPRVLDLGSVSSPLHHNSFPFRVCGSAALADTSVVPVLLSVPF